MQNHEFQNMFAQEYEVEHSAQSPNSALANFSSKRESQEQIADPHRLDNLFSTLIGDMFGNQPGWLVRETEAWIIVTREAIVLPDQGWKLHVSAGLSSAEALLRVVLPILRDTQVTFKVASTLHHLRSLNHGFLGSSQIGKFITLYPVDEHQAVQLASQLDANTRGFRGPVVPSDWQLHAKSVVSYRYGSYKRRLMYIPSGKVVSSLTTPAGELVADLRRRESSAPEWLQNPFLTAGIAQCPEKSPLTLIGGRYLQLAPLYESPRGGTSKGVDIAQTRPCVLKYARRDAYLDFDGKDARDTLRYEASILASLAPDEAFPALFDLIEQDGTLYMVMEEVRGETLGVYAGRTFAEGSLPLEQIIQWGQELARILGKIHTRGLVYRDLKPTNLLVTEEKRLRLIDFELAVAQGHQHAKRDIGTRGFMSPQHRNGDPANIADDIYSLGALLFYLVTRASPNYAPDSSNLLQRPLHLLNPSLNNNLLQFITTCLAPNPSERYSSMEAVEAALEHLHGDVLGDAPPLGKERLPQTAVCDPTRALMLARQLGETLCQSVVRLPEYPGVTWLSTIQFPEGMPLRSLNTGTAGTVLALAELALRENDTILHKTLREGAHWLMRSTEFIRKPIPGLYTGEAGVGAALLRTAQVLKDPDILAAACEKGRWVARQPYTCQDMMNGAAGRLRFHLLLWDETGEDEHLQAAIEAGNWLCETAEDAGEGALCWTLPTDFTGLAYVGYAHGAAGIADALLDLFESTCDERLLPSICGAYRLIERLAVPALPDRTGLNWPLYVHENKHEMADPYWCHGSGGISTFLLHLSEHQDFAHARELAHRAAWAVARGARWAGPTQCHGLAGNIECLLTMFQATGEQEWYAEAHVQAFLLETFATRQSNGLLAWLSDTPSCVSPDYLLGYAGVLACLLRMVNPDQQPHQLSRRGFRYKPQIPYSELSEGHSASYPAVFMP